MGVRQFNSPAESFLGLDAEDAATLIATATDIALVLDRDGIIRDLSVNTEDLTSNDYEAWLGKSWCQIVTVESRAKVEALLKTDSHKPGSRPTWRHLNHPSSSGPDLPVQYITVPIGNTGMILAIGRSAVKLADLQQRLLQAQQSMEKSYLANRLIETRYRLLFQVCSEAVFLIDANSLKVIEVNPASKELLDDEQNRLAGQRFVSLFEEDSQEVIHNLLMDARSTGRRIKAAGRLKGRPEKSQISVALFDNGGTSLYLALANPLPGEAGQTIGSKMAATLIRIMESAPDGFVVTGPDGRILSANEAFLELIQSASEQQVRGKFLDQWFGRTSVDLNVLIANLLKHGSVRLFATKLRGKFGTLTDVEVSATKVALNGDDPSFGFMIRDVSTRVENSVVKWRPLSRPVEQLTSLVGRMPLKDLVQESTDMVERYCIEAALELSGENRTSAAEILGLSRQSLYVKLRRYGLVGAEQGDR
jgi:transcriptional regulator PpsR